MKDLNEVFRLQVDASADWSWKVIPERHLLELWRNASGPSLTRQLEPRLIKLLCLLAAAEGQVLTREELFTALWPRVVVNENSLTRAVSDLRKALNPEPAAPACKNGMIETVPKRGYRLEGLVLPAEHVHAALPASTVPRPDAASDAIAHPLSQRLGSWGMLAVAIATSAVLSSIWTRQTLDTGLPANLIADRSQVGAVQEAHSPALIGDQVISNTIDLPQGLQWRESIHMDQGAEETEAPTVTAPDGRFVAFVEQYPGQYQLRLRSLGEPADDAWTVFTSHAPITHLQWSPLDAGLLFTVEDMLVTPAVLGGSTTGAATASRLARLMLLDLESLEVRELYRRAVPSEPMERKDIYKASGNLT
ncbi:MAG TPA: winged helix-turn-helix domain-containing protein [Pseudohongiella sp.]|nr:winged helix-turn-helix domain-containing protein [Pseudohongiella sp.]